MGKVASDTYRDQLARLVDAMTRPNREADVARDLSCDSTPSSVKMFVDGNFEKRLDKLNDQLALLSTAFDEFDELIVAYIRANKSAAFDNVTTDGERMLHWLAATQHPTPQQQDYLACQHARHAVEDVARQHRLKHVRFQELYSVIETTLAELPANPRLTIHLNPIRVWSRFETSELLDDETSPPANVVFFAVGEEIHTAALELEGQALVNELADFQPCTLDQWAALSMQADREELASTCRDLAEMGLVALG